jgi:hypothetical protein
LTLLSTKYNAAKNWAQRLPIAREIMKEVRAERITTVQETVTNDRQQKTLFK